MCAAPGANPSAPTQGQARRWLFTGYRPGEQNDVEDRAWCLVTRELWFSQPFLDEHKIRYLVIGIEQGDENKRWHLQGYLELSHQQRLSYLKKLNYTFHFIIANGTAEENTKYCSKGKGTPDNPIDPDVQIYGKPITQGERSDVSAVATALLDNPDYVAVATANPAATVRYYRGMQHLHALAHPPQRRHHPIVYRIDGAPGIGKSRSTFHYLDDLVEHKHINGYYVVTENENGWFDGYNGQDAVVFEDFRGVFPIDKMLKLVDLYPFSAPTKGGHVPIRARFFFFTSNAPLEDFYQTSQHDAWVRRIGLTKDHVRATPLWQPDNSLPLSFLPPPSWVAISPPQSPTASSSVSLTDEGVPEVLDEPDTDLDTLPPTQSSSSSSSSFVSIHRHAYTPPITSNVAARLRQRKPLPGDGRDPERRAYYRALAGLVDDEAMVSRPEKDPDPEDPTSNY